ncbi:probable sodium/potassium/calcium exchanger CG1090 isoform X2 [Hyposmocoma kahamanoa]|uniref:probable sodium/potassium/calcium exchanger CG1090 isoform X2 n=1 Tax=Hyposmocoma kahamanoa TaxID=1477025 RepID=UPI000E6D71A4|nr:probable sodium/potassium/calcium exchanger CG1090 isoform X2 [Hyposmocoma kahamanoa]
MQPTRMRRPRRHRWLTVSVFFIAYSVFQAVLNPAATGEITEVTSDEITEKITPTEAMETVRTSVNEDDRTRGISPTLESKEDDDEEEETTKNGKGRQKEAGVSDETEEGEKKIQKDAGYSEYDVIPTVHPKRNCTPPAIEQFPKPLMGQYARRHGGLIIHILVCIFTFIGLAIVCDEYFVSSLDRICEELKLAPDVAGATFMAAGSSAPELATVVIGVFCAQDDIGVSGVIGSAVFNIMFVISVCALCAGTVSHLNWWPLCRDCFFYAISILVMLCTIANGYVSWPEALFMLIMYVVYCIALRFNSALERWAMTLPLPFKLPTREEQAALVTYRSAGGQPATAAPAGDGQYAEVEGQTKETPLQNPPYNPEGAYDNAAYHADPMQAWDPNQSWDSNTAWGEQQSGTVAAAPATTGWGSNQWGNQDQPPPYDAPQQQQQQEQQPQQPQPAAPQTRPVAAQPTYYKAKEYNPETAVNPLVKPVGASFTLGIPDTVMGLTFVAAGVSVPDALSSLAVIKEGYGDMAVSNAVGSNVFDILVCLGLPWFIQTAIIHPGSHVNVISKGLIYSTLSLFSTVIFLVVATHANGWKLDRKYGAVLMVWYLLFITFASLYELNIFGDFHPPDCGSSY